MYTYHQRQKKQDTTTTTTSNALDVANRGQQNKNLNLAPPPFSLSNTAQTKENEKQQQPSIGKNASPVAPNPILQRKPIVQRNTTDAYNKLKALEQKRAQGKKVTEIEQKTAEQNALTESEKKVSGAAKGAGGSEIANVNSRIAAEIGRIESARSRGYLEAIVALNAEGLDKATEYQSFGLAASSNFLWSLKGFIPGPVGGIADSGAELLKMVKLCTNDRDAFGEANTATEKMAAEFKTGMPSGSTSSQIKAALTARMNTLNSSMTNSVKRALPRMIAKTVSSTPPTETETAAAYAAKLETAVSNALYGSSPKNGSGQVDTAKIQAEAKAALLKQYVAGSSSIGKKGFFGGQGGLKGTKSADGGLVDSAIELLGGQNAIEFEKYELVFNQINAAARDLGVTPNFSRKSMESILDGGSDTYLSISSWNKSAIFSGQPSRWMNPLHTSNIVETTSPRITNEAYMQAENIEAMEFIHVMKSSLSKRTVNGKTYYSADQIWFQAKAGKSTKGFITVDMPKGSFLIKYNIQG